MYCIHTLKLEHCIPQLCIVTAAGYRIRRTETCGVRRRSHRHFSICVCLAFTANMRQGPLRTVSDLTLDTLLTVHQLALAHNLYRLPIYPSKFYPYPSTFLKQWPEIVWPLCGCVDMAMGTVRHLSYNPTSRPSSRA